MIWLSASCTLIILSNSVGCLALPRRMTSVVGSNTLTGFPSACVSPRSTRARVCFTTCFTRGHRLQFFLHPFHSGLLHYVGRTLHSCGDIFGKALGLPTTSAVAVNSFSYRPFILSRPCSLLLRLARAISTTRNFTLLVRLRNFVPTTPVISLIR